jgi:hypothetical protein
MNIIATLAILEYSKNDRPVQGFQRPCLFPANRLFANAPSGSFSHLSRIGLQDILDQEQSGEPEFRR